MPTISVIIPAYNAKDCLRRAVDSVFNQTYKDLEILIIDDASTDNTLEIAYQISKMDSRVKVFSQTPNQGPSVARNCGLKAASGKWVAVLDADDALTSDRLSVLLETAERYSADVVSDNLLLYDHGADQVFDVAFPWQFEHKLSLDFLLKRDVYMQGYPLGWIKPMWRLEFLNRKGLKYPVQYRHAEDFFLLASALLEGATFWLIPKPGYVYTLRHGPVSGKSSPFSASTPNLENIAASVEELTRCYDGQLSANQKRLLSKRVARFISGAKLLEIRGLFKNYLFFDAVRVLLFNPAAGVLFVKIKIMALINRL